MKYQVLGPVAAILGDRPVPLGGPKPRAVLAALLSQANQFVSEQRLYSLVWGDRPPATVRGRLQICVSGLRKLLGRRCGAPLAVLFTRHRQTPIVRGSRLRRVR
ncbi:AfsR/SARP family transcriptional regulator [Amycolatopsis vastitatis]|uniref:OmpR/PhoB-type domain-containing protein n=1 Tax=Amycolatopsis vastitatis TaxID=1905142 RepID=A0A229SVV9_9PSEU|nr:winged helix-turn-helix domain-containing protein [Amycolatopsis vastitatis]OXM62900.1 hypothetical protein CF165_31435 [Amycolatopsis vastitatis]